MSTQYTLSFHFDLAAFSRGEAPGGWFFDSYTPGVVFHYGEEGEAINSLLVGGIDTTTGRLYQYAGNTDNGTAVACYIQTPSKDQGDPRENKLYGDAMVDADGAGVTVTVAARFNNNTVIATGGTVSASGRAIKAIPFSTAWQTYRNVALIFSWSITSSSKPLLYTWEPRWTFESAPISALAWEIAPSTFGMENYKHLGFYRITHISTANIQIVVTVDGVAQTPITIAHSSGIQATTVGRFPVYKGKLLKVRIAEPTQTTEFKLDTRDSYIECKPWGSDGPYQQLRIMSDFAMVEG